MNTEQNRQDEVEEMLEALAIMLGMQDEYYAELAKADRAGE